MVPNLGLILERLKQVVVGYDDLPFDVFNPDDNASTYDEDALIQYLTLYGFSATDAREFASRYRIEHQITHLYRQDAADAWHRDGHAMGEYRDDGFGFSGTLYYDNGTGRYIIAARGTEGDPGLPTAGASNDWAENIISVGAFGTAFRQIVEAYNWVERLITPAGQPVRQISFNEQWLWTQLGIGDPDSDGTGFTELLARFQTGNIDWSDGTLYRDTQTGAYILNTRGSEGNVVDPMAIDWYENFVHLGPAGVAVMQMIEAYNWFERLRTEPGEPVRQVHLDQETLTNILLSRATDFDPLIPGDDILDADEFEVTHLTHDADGNALGLGIITEPDATVQITGHSLGAHLALSLSYVLANIDNPSGEPYYDTSQLQYLFATPGVRDSQISRMLLSVLTELPVESFDNFVQHTNFVNTYHDLDVVADIVNHVEDFASDYSVYLPPFVPLPINLSTEAVHLPDGHQDNRLPNDFGRIFDIHRTYQQHDTLRMMQLLNDITPAMTMEEFSAMSGGGVALPLAA